VQEVSIPETGGSVNIAGVECGGENPCRFIAEISNNHNGDIERAFRLIEAAKEAGADLVKFQAYTSLELVELRGNGKAPEPWGSEGWTMANLYEKAATPLAWFGELSGKCAEVGIPWFASVFGKVSLMQMEYYGCAAYKLASLDREATWLFNAVAKTGKPVIVSRPDYPDLNADATLYCKPGYPQYEPDFPHNEGFDGFSYHGTDIYPCINAAVSGASLIECHFQLDDEPSELEANISLTASQFKSMVDGVRYFDKAAA
jgi:sialic acid synthase SpsE